ncbi:hypothetical protein LCGC14_0329930 [marine sediment metagenome]|uniref:Uncharacterized protein n=1 Tax=marine sediment metagenome TaxID=412755 RepID=A0A0F9TGP6_9ZZZZ
MLTDTELLDWLDSHARHEHPGSGWICRDSVAGRGLRLHEANREDSLPTVRESIAAMIRTDKWKKGELEEQE